MANIKSAYKASKNVYDTVLTRETWWSKLYNMLFWGGADDTEISKQVLAMIPDHFDGKLLDVPVGTAVFTLEKYKKLKHAEITCLDYSEDMLSLAKKRFESACLPNIKCVQGDVGNLEFKDESFDLLLSMNGFHAFPEKNKAFLETARVLKPGGTFCGCFYIQGQNQMSDLIVNTVLSKKGWFTPPFQSYSELKAILQGLYSNVELFHEQAIAYFKCIK